MRRYLKRHPDSPSSPVAQIDVEIARPEPDRLLLSYAMIGSIRDVSIPPIMAPARGDRLWQHTCFEAFLRAEADPAYYEFNFAPSKQWAAYRFDDYRGGMRVVDEIETIPVGVAMDANSFTLQVALPFDNLSELPCKGARR